MSQQSPPFALQQASHSAQLFRQMLQAHWMRTGVPDSLSYQVVAQSTPNMSVKVNGGQAIIDGTQVSSIFASTGLSAQGNYFALNDAQVTLTIATSNTQPRIDVVYVAVNDQQYSGTTNNAVLGVVTGTPASSPTVPALPNNALSLAQVAVGANVTSITNANITRTDGSNASTLAVVQGTVFPCTSTTHPSGSRPGQPVYESDTTKLRLWNGNSWASYATTTLSCTSTTHPASPEAGQMIYETDTGNFLVYSGSAWVKPNGAISDSGWQTPSLFGFTNISGRPMQYKLRNNVVWMRGGSTNNGSYPAPSSTMFTLPAGYRPGQTQYFLTSANISGVTEPYVAQVGITTTGAVTIAAFTGTAPAGSSFSFDGISFLAEN